MLGLCLLLSKCLTAKGSLCQDCIAYPSVSLRQGCIAYPSVSLRQGCIAFPRVWLLMLGPCFLSKCHCQKQFMPGLHRIFKFQFTPGLHRLSKCQFAPGLHRLSKSLAVKARAVSPIYVSYCQRLFMPRLHRLSKCQVTPGLHRLSKCQFTPGLHRLSKCQFTPKRLHCLSKCQFKPELHRLSKSLAVNAMAVSPIKVSPIMLVSYRQRQFILGRAKKLCCFFLFTSIALSLFSVLQQEIHTCTNIVKVCA